MRDIDVPRRRCGGACAGMQVEHSRDLDRTDSVAARSEQGELRAAKILSDEVRMIRIDHLSIETEI
ncbi:hypothetical protein AB0B66_23905 [Catellatospora sp. NPDC049111]|uniref:hypothetical protein n=1 Tax=Catellatospora sp. NPDC049111 TaxID=3155271 RepID=UPI0033CF3D9D